MKIDKVNEAYRALKTGSKTKAIQRSGMSQNNFNLILREGSKDSSVLERMYNAILLQAEADKNIAEERYTKIKSIAATAA